MSRVAEVPPNGAHSGKAETISPARPSVMSVAASGRPRPPGLVIASMMRRHGDIFTGVRQKGLVLGLEFNHPEGAVAVSRALYENGVWAIFSSLDKRVLQWKPGVLLTAELCEEILQRFDAAMPRARDLRK